MVKKTVQIDKSLLLIVGLLSTGKVGQFFAKIVFSIKTKFLNLCKKQNQPL